MAALLWIIVGFWLLGKFYDLVDATWDEIAVDWQVYGRPWWERHRAGIGWGLVCLAELGLLYRLALEL